MEATMKSRWTANRTNTPHAPAPTRGARGLSLVECLMTLAVATVTLGAALPGLQEMRERRQLDGAAAQLETDLHYARSIAASQHSGVRIAFQSGTAGTCYVVHTGPAGACDCLDSGPARCTAGQAPLRSVRLEAADGIRLASNVPSILFDGSMGTSTPTGTVRLLGHEGRELRLVVNLMGRVRTCSPAGTFGYKAC